MKKFMAVYMMPSAGLEAWMQLPETERKSQESAMQKEWQTWEETNKAALTGETAGMGKTKRITKGGVADTKNDMMLFTTLEAASHEDAVAIFVNHPHLAIEGAWIDVMPINPLPGMQQ